MDPLIRIAELKDGRQAEGSFFGCYGSPQPGRTGPAGFDERLLSGQLHETLRCGNHHAPGKWVEQSQLTGDSGPTLRSIC